MQLLFVALLAAVAIAAYYFSEARRWRQAAEKLGEEASAQKAELDVAKRIAIEKESESASTRRLAETQAALLTKYTTTA